MEACRDSVDDALVHSDPTEEEDQLKTAEESYSECESLQTRQSSNMTDTITPDSLPEHVGSGDSNTACLVRQVTPSGDAEQTLSPLMTVRRAIEEARASRTPGALSRFEDRHAANAQESSLNEEIAEDIVIAAHAVHTLRQTSSINAPPPVVLVVGQQDDIQSSSEDDILWEEPLWSDDTDHWEVEPYSLEDYAVFNTQVS